MTDKELNINEIIRVETLPVIFQQLEVVGVMVDEELEKFKDIECTEENKQEVKKTRTSINNTLKVFEDKRKEIKNQVLEAYNQFNDKYELEVKTKLENASNELKTKIDYIESSQLAEKEIELREFVKQHCESNHIHIEFERIGLNITLSASMKSLKEKALEFINKVVEELKLIDMEEYKEEILLEYNNTFNYVDSKIKVIERHEKLEEIKKQQEIIGQKEKEEEKIVEQVEEIVAPKEVVEEQEVITVTFTITDTKENIIKVREFMKEEGIKYE